jgi:hypothetical protein
MKIEIQLTGEDMRRVFAGLTPVRVALDAFDPKRYISLREPSRVDIVEDGLRLSVGGSVQWDVVGIKVPVEVRTIGVRLAPRVAEQDGREVLFLGLGVESVDVSSLPGFVESELVQKVNDALRTLEATLAWAFTDSLDFYMRLPRITQPRRTVHLFATHASVRTTKDLLTLVVDFGLDAERTGIAGLRPTPSPQAFR